MNKRGNVLAAVGFFFVLFLLFLILRYTGYGNVSGYVVGEADDNNFSINNILFTRINVLNETSFELIEGEEFYKYDSVGCIIEYNGNITSENLSIGFYYNNAGIDDPDLFYSNILNDSLDETLCDEEINTCLVYYNVTNFEAGVWKCFARYNNETDLSNSLEMVNRAPILLRDLSNVQLNVDGSYVNSTLDLDNYFIDLEGDDLSYGAVGQLHIAISVGSDGVVRFSNPTNWEGLETVIFRAYDGMIGTFTSNVSIAVGSGVTLPASVCNPFWDCQWGECVDDQQTCVYYDRNDCGVNTGRPANLVRGCAVYQNGETSVSSAVSQENLRLEDIKEPEVKGTKRTLLLVGIIILVMAIIGLATYLLISLKKKSGQKKEIKQTAAGIQSQAGNVSELQRYIDVALQGGQTEQKIQQDLLNVGWPKKDIDSSLNYIKLKKFVKDKLASGFSKEKIIESLKAKGWKDDVINSILKELNS